MNTTFVLFDFDGVIVDSYAPAFEVHKMKCPHVTEADFERRFEGNINEYDIQAEQHTPECRLDLDFFEHYLPKMDRITLVPGMDHVIAKLARDHSLVIISSTLTLPIRSMLERFGIAQYFRDILGNDTHHSKVEKMRMVFDTYGVSPASCVFITDTLGDLREATHAGVGSIGVTWGFHTEETLHTGAPFTIIRNPAEMISAVEAYFARSPGPTDRG